MDTPYIQIEQRTKQNNKNKKCAYMSIQVYITKFNSSGMDFIHHLT